MQKWCPEPLVADNVTAGVFEPLAAAIVGSSAADRAGFRPEAGFTDPHCLLRQLSRSERAQVMELLDQDVRREYEDKCRLETAAREKADTERKAADATAREQWQRELAAGLRREIEDALATVAKQTVSMATLMAVKLVRREVAADPEVLVRTLETVLYKAEAGCSLSITAHPEDAAWLEAAPELRERLRIREIKADRRLERGGCLVRANDLEWDATVERQLAVLGEALDEALAVPPELVDEPAAEPDADPDAEPQPEDHDA